VTVRNPIALALAALGVFVVAIAFALVAWLVATI
jgi:hypothetical protein